MTQLRDHRLDGRIKWKRDIDQKLSLFALTFLVGERDTCEKLLFMKPEKKSHSGME
jgi:hypothetical protein